MSDPAVNEPPQHLTPNQRAWLRFKRHKPAIVSAWFLAVLVLLVIVWPWIAPYSYEEISDAQFKPPSSSHWFGTDVHGRDVLTRMFFGARISLLVGIVGAAVALVIGVTWGAVAGYVGGRADGIMMRFVDVLYSLPSILFVIVLVATRFVSLGSIFGACASPLLHLLHGGRFAVDPYQKHMVTVFLALVSLFIIIRHRQKIARILRGEERRIGAPPRQHA